MASVRDILDDFVNKAGNAILSPLPPDRDTLGGFNPDFRELKRDDLGIIMMPQQSCGEISPDLDGGDSAHREGVAAFCNSEPDKKLLDLFVNNSGVMVRHPNQVPWNEPDNSSADQLRGFMVGCWRAGRSDLAQRLLVAHEARNWHCQNIMAPERCPKLVRKNPKPPDVLAPQEVMGLRIAAGMNEAYLDLLGQLRFRCFRFSKFTNFNKT